MRIQLIITTLLGLNTVAANYLRDQWQDNPDEDYFKDTDELDESSTNGRLLASRYSATNAEFSPYEVNSALNMINSERQFIAQQRGGSDLIKLKINTNLTKALQEFIAIPGSVYWGYEDADVPPPSPGYNHYTKFHLLKENMTFQNIMKKYAGLYEHVMSNDMDVMHDTYKPRDGSALQVVRLRVNQRDCLNYTNCVTKQPLTFNNFQSCSKYPNVNNLPNQCLWFYWYYARMVESRAMEIAFVKLHQPGRFVVNTAQTQAWLFMIILNGIQPRLTNVPYQVGGACTKCPPNFSGCNHGLCIAVPTAAPTLEPSAIPTLKPTKAPTVKIG